MGFLGFSIMNNTEIIALLLIVAANIGILLLLQSMRRSYLFERQNQIFGIEMLLTQVGAIRKQLDSFERNTDYRIRQVKTRLADEERDDQKERLTYRSQDDIGGL